MPSFALKTKNFFAEKTGLCDQAFRHKKSPASEKLGFTRLESELEFRSIVFNLLAASASKWLYFCSFWPVGQCQSFKKTAPQIRRSFYRRSIVLTIGLSLNAAPFLALDKCFCFLYLGGSICFCSP